MSRNEIPAANPRPRRHEPSKPKPRPELFQIVIECRDEMQQRKLFDRLRRDGLRVRLLVL
jgi:hypothetical protein